MHGIAKATIIIPIVVIAAAAMLRMSNTSYMSNRSGTVSISVTPPQRTAVPVNGSDSTSSKKITDTKITLDFKGPLACFHTDLDKNIKLFIQNRQIYAKFVEGGNTNYYLFKEDCLYKWEEGQQSGIKFCKVGQYLSVVESLSKMPFFSPSLLFSFLPQLQGSAADSIITSEEVSKIMKSCQKVTIDEVLFKIPSTVQFVEEKISGVPENFLK